MAGGLQMPKPISRETITKEGQRRGYDGEGLHDFTEIVVSIDDAFVRIDAERQAAETKAAASNAHNKKR